MRRADAVQLLADLTGLSMKSSKVLLASSGGLSRLVAIPPENIEEFAEAAGVPLTQAQALRLISAFYLVKEYGFDVAPDGEPISHPREAAARCAFMAGLTQEEFWVLDLDSKHRVMRQRLVHRGALSTTVVHPRAVYAPAMVGRAESIIGIHNHPSGDARPSLEDLEMTERLKKVAELVGLTFLDHIIIAGNQYFSIDAQYGGEVEPGDRLGPRGRSPDPEPRRNPSPRRPGGATLLIYPPPPYHAGKKRGRRARSSAK